MYCTLTPKDSTDIFLPTLGFNSTTTIQTTDNARYGPALSRLANLKCWWKLKKRFLLERL